MNFLKELQQRSSESCSSEEKALSSAPDGEVPKESAGGLKALLASNLTFKSKVVFRSFCDYDMSAFIKHRSMTCAERMRELDLFRFHTPTEQERGIAHLPTDRLNLQSPKDVMYLCGGLVGVRFNTDELHHLTDLTHRMASLWDNLVRLFEAFHLSLKKFRIESEPRDSCESTRAVMEFHDAGDAYMVAVQELQSFVKAKQGSIDRNAHINLGNVDVDGLIGHRYPQWFTVLREKYEKEVLGIDTLATRSDDASSPNDDKPCGVGTVIRVGSNSRPRFTLGKFAVFLGKLGTDAGCLLPKEREAIAELLEASQDFNCIFGSRDSASTPAGVDTKELSRRYFNFLRSVPELKSTVLDEEALESTH